MLLYQIIFTLTSRHSHSYESIKCFPFLLQFWFWFNCVWIECLVLVYLFDSDHCYRCERMRTMRLKHNFNRNKDRAEIVDCSLKPALLVHPLTISSCLSCPHNFKINCRLIFFRGGMAGVGISLALPINWFDMDGWMPSIHPQCLCL